MHSFKLFINCAIDCTVLIICILLYSVSIGHSSQKLEEKLQNFEKKPFNEIAKFEKNVITLFAITLEALAQHLEHAFGFQFFAQVVQHHRGRVVVVNGLQALPNLGLGGLYEIQYQCRV